MNAKTKRQTMRTLSAGILSLIINSEYRERLKNWSLFLLCCPRAYRCLSGRSNALATNGRERSHEYLIVATQRFRTVASFKMHF